MQTKNTALPDPNITPEKNLLGQVREWTDLFPWLRLVRVCRVAGGPIWITHTFLVMCLWLVGLHGISIATQDTFANAIKRGDVMARSDIMTRRTVLSQSSHGLALTTETPPIETLTSGSLLPLAIAQEVVTSPLSETVSQPLRAANMLTVVWTVLIWLPTTTAFIRVGALLTAGRDMPSYVETLRLVVRRIGPALLVACLPLLCSLPFLIGCWLVGLVANWIGAFGGEGWQLAIAVLAACITIPCGLIVSILFVAGKVAVPFGLASLMTNSDADPMDSLSRGYEYTLRRLPQLFAYALVAAVLSVIVFAGWSLIVGATEQFLYRIHPANRFALSILPKLAASIAVMLTWSMAGGVYLLLRQSASGQEPEDIWAEPDGWQAPELPSVQQPTT
ncbi:hypothetical protein [Neorhodopirellula lusitana]|uniref:hypothetical protein n=1 Tax=Neorhodopirellula lusitana TaxID=445327 RepID=UPI00384F342F